MKKVAIMTYHDMVNYGSLFQMYCLQQIVKDLGFKVDIINYRKDINYLKKFVNNNKFLKNICLHINNDELWLKFNKFYKNNINKTKIVSSNDDLKKLNKKYDYFIAGSDQIWSPNHFDIHYFLDFVEDQNKLISYAPSVVIDDFNYNQIKEVKKILSNYKAISIREKTGQTILKKNFNVDSLVVLDPTLLVDISYLKNISKNVINNKKYNIICYFLGNNNYEEKINKIFDKEEITNISLNKKQDFKTIENINNAGPEEFINYLSNCKFICTDSYHGVALAIKLHKQFILFDRFDLKDPICQNARIYDLLNLLKIDSVNYSNYISHSYKEINYDLVQKELNKLILNSKEFLRNALEVECNE